MKIQSISLLFIIVLFVLQGCYEDKGNYDYISTNSLKITLNPKNTSGFLGESYVYYPKIEFADKSDTLGFEYWWEFTGTLSGGGYDTLCIGRELNFIPDITGYINVQLCAKELSTGYITTAPLQLRINSPYAKGWAILTQENNRTVFSFVRPGYEETEDEDVRVYTSYVDIYSQLFPEDDLGQQPYRLKQVMNSEDCMLLVIQDNNPVYLNGSTLEKIMTMDKEFANEEYPVGLQIKDFFYGAKVDLVLGESGDLYTRYFQNIQGEYSPFFSAAFIDVPAEFEGEILNVSDLIFTAPSYTYIAVVHEASKNRLLYIPERVTANTMFLKSNMIVENTDEYIDLNNFDGYEMLFCGTYGGSSSSRGRMLALFQDNAGKVKVQDQAIQIENVYPSVVDFSEVKFTDFSGAPYINDKTTYFMLETRPYFFFASDNALYWYDIAAGVTREFYRFQSGDEIVEMASNPQESELGILLKSGTFVVLNIRNENLYSAEKMYELSGLGQGVSLMYKYPNYTDYLFRTTYAD